MAKRPKKLNERELAALLNAEIDNSLGMIGGELSSQREKSMNYYLGEPFGDEVSGRSQVVSTEVADTIEWIMPSLMRVFTSTDEAVRFEPVGPEDEEAAEQETLAVNHKFYKQNDGFLVLYSWLKDALLSKNGYVKAWWNPSEERTKEEYEGLTDAELFQLMDDDEVELLEHAERPGMVPLTDMQTGEQQMVPGTVHDVTFERVGRGGRLEVVPLPPEEFLISKDAREIHPKSARFCGHHKEWTVSELREAGFPESQIQKLARGDDSRKFHTETVARHHLDDETDQDEGPGHEATEVIWVTEGYYRVDYDGDGIAELRQVFISGNEILSNEEVDTVPFYALTPRILTHKHFGLSVADLVMDLQQIKSTLWRQVLDNMYRTNNVEKVVVEELVNLSDLLVSRPGGIKRVRGNNPANVQAIQPLVHQPIVGESFPLLQYVDEVRKNRTGVGDEMMGLDADTLSQANTGVVNQSFDAARMMIEMIARVFAETGVKALFRGIHELMQKHQNKAEVMQLRGKWIEVNPSEWRTRRDMSVTVGLGTGNRDQNLVHLAFIWQQQKEILFSGAQQGIVTAANAFNTLSKIVENAGLGRDADLFFTDPQQSQMQPAGQDAAAQQAALAQAQLEIQKAAVQLRAKELELKELEIIQKGQTERLKAQAASETTFAKLQADFEMERTKLKEEITLEQRKLAAAEAQAELGAAASLKETELRTQAQIAAAQISAGVQVERVNLDREKLNDERRASDVEGREQAVVLITDGMVQEMRNTVAKESDEKLGAVSGQLEERIFGELQRMSSALGDQAKQAEQQAKEAAQARADSERRRQAIMDFIANNGSDKAKKFVGGLQ